MNGMTSSSGTLGWSSAAGGLVMHEPDIAHQLASLQRLALLEAAMEHTEAARVTALPAFPESDLLRDGAWLAPVQLAKDRGAALWSDDVALRNLARTIGVPAFSTTSVQELRAVHALDALATDDTADTEQILNARQLEANTALEHRVVDLPVTVDDLIDTATAEQFPADLAHATIGRPAWWTWSTNPWQDLHALLSVVAARTDSGTTLQWRVAAMVGAADLNQGDAVRVAVWLAAVTLVPTSDEPAAGLGAQMLAAADAIASRVGGASPRAHLPQAAAELHALGFLDNPQQIVAEMLSGDEATAVVA